MCTIENTVIKIILRALTDMLLNSHPALQRTPAADGEMGTGGAGGNGCWWRMKRKLVKEMGATAVSLSLTYTHIFKHDKNNPTVYKIMKGAPLS